MKDRTAPKVVLYTTPNCPLCKKARNYLVQKGAAVEEIDVAADRRAADEMMQRSGQMGVPVMLIGSTVLVGFNPLRIDVALKLMWPSS